MGAMSPCLYYSSIRCSHERRKEFTENARQHPAAAGAVSALSPAGLTTLAGTDDAAGYGMPGVPGMPAPTVARASGVLPRYGVRLMVMAHPLAAG
jgi:hypothetical protein